MARQNRTNHDTFARLLGSYADQTAEPPEDFVIPEDLAAVTDEDLNALQDEAVAHFDELYGDGSGLTDADLVTLASLTEGIERITAELNTRREAAVHREQEAAELAARAHPVAVADEPEEGEEGEEQLPESDTSTEPVIEGTVVEGTEPEAIAAAASRRGEIRVNLAGLRSRQPANTPRPASQAQGIRDVMLASGDGSGFAAGQGVDFLEAAQIVDRRLAGFNEAAYEQATKRGQNLRQQFGVVTIRKPIPEDMRINSNDPSHIDDVVRRAMDESRLPGGSLVASGGWCAPSEILYGNLLELESRDGLISVPEIGISRGGINYTTGVDFWDIYNGTGFDYTEQNDIDAHYAAGATTAETQTVTITGTPTGGTFRLAFNGAPTAAIAYNATAAQVLAAVRAVVGYDQLSGATGGALPGTAVVLTFGGTLLGVDVPMMTVYASALTGGSNPAVAVTESQKGATAANADGDKPCYKVTCPSFTDVRLGTAGLCVTAGLLQQRGYPEVISRTVRGALVAHDHKMSARVINKMVAGSTAVIMSMDTVGTLAPMLSAIEKQVEHYRYVHRASRGATLEAVFPYWILGAIRSDLALRTGQNLVDVTDGQIRSWFTTRGVNAQFVYDWQAITGAAGTFLNWPSVVQFLLYAAGTWVKGTSDVITLDTVYDTQLVKQNDYTALFTEEGYLVAKMAVDSRVVSVPVCASGATSAARTLDCNGVLTS